MPIRWRLTLWYSSILTIILFVFGMLLYLFFVRLQYAEMDRILQQTSNDVLHSIKVRENYLLPLQQIVLPDMDTFASPGIYLQVINTNGNIVSRSRSLGEEQLPLRQQTIQSVAKGEPIYETTFIKGVKLRIYHVPLILNDRVIGLLQVGASLQRTEESLRNLRNLLLIGAALTILIAGSFGWLLAKRVLQPIGTIVKSTSNIQAGRDLKERIAYDGPKDEIGLLVDQINRMFARLEKAYQELEESYAMQKRFVSDASHELRTPLTSMRGNIDFLLKAYRNHPEMAEEVLNDVSKEIDRLTRLINHLLSLARADAGYQMVKEAIDFHPFLDAIILEYQQKERNIPLHVNGMAEILEVKLQGNRDFLKQLFYIVLDNAFKYTRDGNVTLSLQQKKVGADENLIEIVIQDTGIGIQAADLPNIFQRFYRGENTKGIPGTGLGLPIAKWIVEMHQGTINITSEVEKGTRIDIILPIL